MNAVRATPIGTTSTPWLVQPTASAPIYSNRGPPPPIPPASTPTFAQHVPYYPHLQTQLSQAALEQLERQPLKPITTNTTNIQQVIEAASKQWVLPNSTPTSGDRQTNRTGPTYTLKRIDWDAELPPKRRRGH